MRIVSWNIHGAPGQGTNREQERAWHHLAALDADLILLQEVRESATPAWVTDEWDLVAGKVGTLGKAAAWGSVIAAKRELNLRSRDDLAPPESWLGIVYDYVIAAEIDLDGTTPAIVASVHAPAVSATKLLENLGKPGVIDDTDLAAVRIEPDDPWSTDVIFHGLERVTGNRFIVGGDWNTARLFDRDKTVPTNALFFARARQHGWVEAHGSSNEERSFFRDGNLPYQLDHVFFDELTAGSIAHCSIWADPGAREISDHAPMVIDLDLATGDAGDIL